MDTKIFEKELNEIKSEELKGLAETVILETPDWYSTMPSSTSGKFHPSDELGLGGKIIHHKKVFKLSEEAARRYDIKDYEYEILRTASLIHDMPYCFYWDVKQERYRTDPLHPFKNAYFCSRNCNDMLLQSAIYFHMGLWSNYESEEAKLLSLSEYQNHPVVLATQESDYYASRRMIIILLDCFR
jgi:hypothetical protein